MATVELGVTEEEHLPVLVASNQARLLLWIVLVDIDNIHFSCNYSPGINRSSSCNERASCAVLLCCYFTGTRARTDLS